MRPDPAGEPSRWLWIWPYISVVSGGPLCGGWYCATAPCQTPAKGKADNRSLRTYHHCHRCELRRSLAKLGDDREQLRVARHALQVWLPNRLAINIRPRGACGRVTDAARWRHGGGREGALERGACGGQLGLRQHAAQDQLQAMRVSVQTRATKAVETCGPLT